MSRYFLPFTIFVLLSHIAPAQQILIQANKTIAPIQPTMWGIFFEDINLAADGGLYAELVKNRSFEFNMPLMGWKVLSDAPGNGTVLVLNRGQEDPNNPRFIRVTRYAGGGFGLVNEGFRGMGIKAGDRYRFSVWDLPHAGADLTLRIVLVNPGGEKIGDARLPLGSETGGKWEKDTVSLTATATEPKAQLQVWFEGQGVADLDMISLFPQDTWKERSGGLRADLVQLLADLHPGFIRFPGGCIVEGRDLANRYQWKKTIGPVEDRKVIINRWNTEFAHRPTPDYYQSYGLGFFEYFQLAEDIGAEPLPILNCGMACQFNTAEVVPTTDLEPYIQDALDLIEFANGGTDTRWGALRAAMGHPAPFHLHMMGVGNEQWGPQYIERYTIFTRAIKEKYPSIRLVNSVGPDPDGPLFNFLNDTLRRMHADLLDEHYYRSPDWFLRHADRYDRYDRNGPRIFAGEYAAQSVATVSPENKNNWRCALAEAAFMTGLERNADVVNMASYAPLFAHVDGWQWTPDLIWFDNLRSYGTPDYYVQKLFSNNKGTTEIPALWEGQPLEGRDSLYASACLDAAGHNLILKIVNAGPEAKTPRIRIEGVKGATGKASVTTLTSKAGSKPLDAVNSLDDPRSISPVTTELDYKAGALDLPLAPFSFTILRVHLRT